MGETIFLNSLSEGKYREILCYPDFKQKEFERRLEELHKLGVFSIEFSGKQKINGISVLGKGCVGIVVIAYTPIGKTALKIRRVDSDREEMFQEGSMLFKANLIEVGPRLLKISKNFLIMKLIDGEPFFKWIKALENGMENKKIIHSILKDILEQCYRLDNAGLDHGELSNASKHIIIDSENVAHLIDFESASINRKVSNVTSICHYLFLGNKTAKILEKKIKKVDQSELIKMLQDYKKKLTRKSFDEILNKILNSN